MLVVSKTIVLLLKRLPHTFEMSQFLFGIGRHGYGTPLFIKSFKDN